jgi:hypothetical protein
VAPQIVCVLGMHRSGTSLATRMLHLLGVSLGDDTRLSGPASDNPTGFWEHGRLVDINAAILHHYGGTWDEPPAFPPDWAASAELDALRAEARGVVADELPSSGWWGWKDPRTCLTLPFWQALLTPSLYLLCLRHPLEVAASLQRRDGFDLAKGVRLWLLHTEAALRYSQGAPRCQVSYEALVDDATRPATLVRLGACLGLGERGADAAVQQAACQFVRADLRHEHSAAGAGHNAGLDAELVARLDELYAALSHEDPRALALIGASYALLG